MYKQRGVSQSQTQLSMNTDGNIIISHFDYLWRREKTSNILF